MKHITTQARARTGGPRAGMTLVEILIAVGILAFGMFGILTMFPVAIRNVQTNFGNTRAAGVARQVTSAMQQGEITLAPDVWNTPTDMKNNLGAGGAPVDWSTLGLTGGNPPKSIGAVIYQAEQGNIGGLTTADRVGNGAGNPAFQIGAVDPTNTGGMPWLYTTLGGDPSPVVPIYRPGITDGDGEPEQTDFGWSATFMPLTDQNNNLTDGVQVGPSTLYRAQISVWRDHQLKYGPTGVTVDTLWGYDGNDNDGDGTDDDPTEHQMILLTQPIPDANPGDYIRINRHGVWYKIEAIGQVGGQPRLVELVGKYQIPGGGALAGTNPTVSIASHYRLLGTFETMVGPRE